MHWAGGLGSGRKGLREAATWALRPLGPCCLSGGDHVMSRHFNLT